MRWRKKVNDELAYRTLDRGGAEQVSGPGTCSRRARWPSFSSPRCFRSLSKPAIGLSTFLAFEAWLFFRSP